VTHARVRSSVRARTIRPESARLRLYDQRHAHSPVAIAHREYSHVIISQVRQQTRPHQQQKRTTTLSSRKTAAARGSSDAAVVDVSSDLCTASYASHDTDAHTRHIIITYCIADTASSIALSHVCARTHSDHCDRNDSELTSTYFGIKALTNCNVM
jgi:hypothetical protein